MNINDFKYILKIAEYGSLNAAARDLFITQPSLSQRVKYIENEYGIVIFGRDHSGVTLTPDGKTFLQYAVRILKCENELRSQLKNSAETNVQTVRLGISWNINTRFFQDFLPALTAAHPDKRFEFIEISSPEQQDALLADKIDLALCYLPISSSELTYRIIFTDTIVVVPRKGGEMAEILARKVPPGSFVNPQRLNNEPISVPSSNSYLRRYIHSVIEAEQIVPEIRHTLKSMPLMYAMAEKGVATGIMFESYFWGRDSMLPYYYLDSSVTNHVPFALAWRKTFDSSDFPDDLANTIRRYYSATVQDR